MKFITVVSGVLIAILCGFLFSGIIGSFLFGALLTITICVLNYLKQRIFSIKYVFVFLLSFTMLGYTLLFIGGLLGANIEVKRKLELIENELESKKYKSSWVIISQKRVGFINKLLSNSSKNSYHLQGKAIDIYVFDVNGDKIFNAVDIKILEQANNEVEKKHPELKGAFGDYYLSKHGYFTKHMIHIDTRGVTKRYTK
jgi:hypothetical protein